MIKRPDSSVLVVGCGNSSLSEMMHLHLGLNKILSIDFEESVISKMKEKNVPIEYKVMDMLNMEGIEN